MMMISTAGGPPPVSLLDFTERRTPRFTRTTWIAVGVVALAHAGLGAALLAQQFELTAPTETPPGPIIDTFMFTPPKPPPPTVKTTVEPPAPNTKTNPLPAPPLASEPLTLVTGDTIAKGPVINTKTIVDEPAPAGTSVEPTPPQPPAVITNPSWLSQPNGDQLMRAYPSRALSAEVEGSVMMNCLVDGVGRVTDCAVTRETPGNYGFGRAAQGLSRHFRLNPRTVNGTAEGARVNIGLRFNLPAD